MDELLIGALALAGVALGWWLQDHSSRAEAKARRRSEAAAALAPIKALLIDAHPVRLTLWNAQEHQQHSIPKILEVWTQARDALFALSIGHPSARVRELAEEAHTALHNALASASFFLDDIVNHRSTQEVHDQAMADHEEARAKFEALAEAIREA